MSPAQAVPGGEASPTSHLRSRDCRLGRTLLITLCASQMHAALMTTVNHGGISAGVIDATSGFDLVLAINVTNDHFPCPRLDHCDEGEHAGTAPTGCGCDGGQVRAHPGQLQQQQTILRQPSGGFQAAGAYLSVAGPGRNRAQHAASPAAARLAAPGSAGALTLRPVAQAPTAGPEQDEPHSTLARGKGGGDAGRSARQRGPDA